MSNRQEKNNTMYRTNKRENPYVMLDKYGLNDERLSWKAKGLLAYLLSKPDDWIVYESNLVKHAKDGRDSVRAGLRELEALGYIAREQDRDDDGSFGKMRYMIYERPIEDTSDDGKSVHGDTENPLTENPSTGNPTLLNNDLNNNDLKKDDDDLTRLRANLFSEFVETGLLTESEFKDKLQHIAKYETSDKLAYGRKAMLNHVRDTLEARTAVLKQLDEAKAQLAATTSQEAVQTSQKPLHSKTKGNSRNKPIIPMIQDTPTTAVTLEELEEMRKVAKKLDGGGFIDA